MGMNISSALSSTNGAGLWQQQRQNFNQLAQALKSGNLDVAKQAFASLSSKSINASDPNSPLGKLGQALQTGDIAAAQQAFAVLRSGHHHHHEATSPNAATSLAASGPVGTNINTSA